MHPKKQIIDSYIYIGSRVFLIALRGKRKPLSWGGNRNFAERSFLIGWWESDGEWI